MAQTTNDTPVNEIINPNCIILDTFSTISSIKNEDLVKYTCVCDIGKKLWEYTNGGHWDYN